MSRGLGRVQRNALRYLAGENGASSTMDVTISINPGVEEDEDLHIARPAVSRALWKMEEVGLVKHLGHATQHYGRTHGRGSYWEITGRGQALVKDWDGTE